MASRTSDRTLSSRMPSVRLLVSSVRLLRNVSAAVDTVFALAVDLCCCCRTWRSTNATPKAVVDFRVLHGYS